MPGRETTVEFAQVGNILGLSLLAVALFLLLRTALFLLLCGSFGIGFIVWYLACVLFQQLKELLTARKAQYFRWQANDLLRSSWTK